MGLTESRRVRKKKGAADAEESVSESGAVAARPVNFKHVASLTILKVASFLLNSEI